MDWYAVTAFHGQIIPSQVVPLNSQTVPQYHQNYSGVFEPQAEARALLLCIPRSLSQEGILHALSQKSIFHIRFSTETVEQSD